MEKINNIITDYSNYIIISSILIILALIIINYININTQGPIYISMEDLKNLINEIMNELIDANPRILYRMNSINKCMDSFLNSIDLNNPQQIDELKKIIIEIIKYSGQGG